ncbi:MAG: tRNA (guanosine(37)-N1)-methyltransferase TrmD [Proteobacteria bacterium]|nr:tRNA (guanosine(37)-N1)-methyltransferase TrmD [Pseudomonadota bacterium]
MDVIVLTIFPEMVEPYFSYGMIRKAHEDGFIRVSAMNIRDYAQGKHRVTDDKPYGGGCGMVMKPEPLAAAIDSALQKSPGAKVVHMTPQGRPFNQAIAQELSLCDGLIFLCGRYEGIDERICQNYIDDEISIGDYVLTGGELGALVVADAVIRLIPGVLGGDDSAEKDSFAHGLLEHAQYTRPCEFDSMRVPDVLLSGNHALIDKWRLETSLIRTFLKRPDLLGIRSFSVEEKKILKNWYLKLEHIIQGDGQK